MKYPVFINDQPYEMEFDGDPPFQDKEQAIRLVAYAVDEMSRQVGRVVPTLGYRVALPPAQYRRVMATIDALYNDVACRLFPDGDDDATRLIFPNRGDAA